MQIFVNSYIMLIVSCRTHHDVYFQNVSAKTQGGGEGGEKHPPLLYHGGWGGGGGSLRACLRVNSHYACLRQTS